MHRPPRRECNFRGKSLIRANSRESARLLPSPPPTFSTPFLSAGFQTTANLAQATDQEEAIDKQRPVNKRDNRENNCEQSRQQAGEEPTFNLRRNCPKFSNLSKFVSKICASRTFKKTDRAERDFFSTAKH